MFGIQRQTSTCYRTTYGLVLTISTKSAAPTSDGRIQPNPAPVAYYEAHAQTFFDGTVNLDLSALHQRFLAHLPTGGHILDAGCGSGRDARAFLDHGYTVTAFDAAPALAELASVHCGLPVHVLRLEEMDWQARFDGI